MVGAFVSNAIVANHGDLMAARDGRRYLSLTSIPQ